ncbi:Uncharacterised protein [Klebsiella pneumoniae]|nr:Uncharacterised protein [Klebsiella pneumoniae]STS27914.1 Uncharacterised protein [Klebsiella pneumoniae]STS47101.1 Uncharacterised protein [Klebsiella pneumoniae]
MKNAPNYVFVISSKLQRKIYPCFLYVFGITKNTSNYQSGSLKVIPLILPLEENFIQPEHYPNQSDNQ